MRPQYQNSGIFNIQVLLRRPTFPSLDTMSSMWRNGTEVGRYDIEYPGSLPRVSPLLGRNSGFPHSLKFGRVSSSGLASLLLIILRCPGEDVFGLFSYIVHKQMKYESHIRMLRLYASIGLTRTLHAIGALHDAHQRIHAVRKTPVCFSRTVAW